MREAPLDLREKLQQHNQSHVLTGWDGLDDAARQNLLAQLATIDLDVLDQLYRERNVEYPVPAPERIAPVPVVGPAERTAETRAEGERALRAGEVAVLLVAGGQGTRLGFDHPKGTYPIGPVTKKTLFQIHVEKVLALGRRYGRTPPFLVMTSSDTDAETRQFFAEHDNFGLPSGEVHFFQQGTMPALDLATGRLLLEAPGQLFLSPNGHGGTLAALRDSGLLGQLQARAIRQVFYFQVDNPLVHIADPFFVGHHRLARAEASSRVVPKESPEDKLGNFVLVDGKLDMIEYSDLPRELAVQTDEQGRLRFAAGNPAIHVFEVDFLDRMAGTVARMPFHRARKKVPHYDPETGQTVQPEKENALKFEKFIFDTLPSALRWVVVESNRREEFAPLKNAAGADSPDFVRQAMSDLAAKWLNAAGVAVPRRPDGSAAVPLEISPLFALDAEELAARVDRRMMITGPTYLG
jgi:UDP-N-acetylglucosamine/UDP-N-acetylgalactosamine diphosphorylase